MVVTLARLGGVARTTSLRRPDADSSPASLEDDQEPMDKQGHRLEYQSPRTRARLEWRKAMSYLTISLGGMCVLAGAAAAGAQLAYGQALSLPCVSIASAMGGGLIYAGVRELRDLRS